jgi:hypothetical protein
MQMAAILAEMPDLWQRFLGEHAPDTHGRCRECRADSGRASGWPCLPYRIALEACHISESARSAPRVPEQQNYQPRRLTSIPAAAWIPRWD